MKLINLLADPQVTILNEFLDAVEQGQDIAVALEGLGADLTVQGQPCAEAVIEVDEADPSHYRVVRMRRADGSAASVPEARLQGGIIGRMIRSPVPKAVHEAELGGDAILGPHFGEYQSVLALPLFIDQAARWWLLLFHREPQAFGPSHLRELLPRTRLLSAMVANLRMAQQLVAANLSAQGEIAQVAEVQAALLPLELPTIPGLRVAATYQSLSPAGGDLYDLVPLGRRPGHPMQADDPRWAVLIGDVSGHGPAAAVVMAILHTLLHAYPTNPVSPGEVAAYMNRHLCSKRVGTTFATAFLSFFDPTTRRFSYMRAGHPPPLLLRRGRLLVEKLEAVGDIPLGIDPDAGYEVAQVQVESGDILLLYTDGIVEARSPAGEMFDSARLESALLTLSDDPNTTIRRVYEALLTHMGHGSAADDQTLLALHVE